MIPGKGSDFFLLHSLHTGFLTHSVCYKKSIMVCFLGGKVASTESECQEFMELV